MVSCYVRVCSLSLYKYCLLLKGKEKYQVSRKTPRLILYFFSSFLSFLSVFWVSFFLFCLFFISISLIEEKGLSYLVMNMITQMRVGIYLPKDNWGLRSWQWRELNVFQKAVWFFTILVVFPLTLKMLFSMINLWIYQFENSID